MAILVLLGLAEGRLALRSPLPPRVRQVHGNAPQMLTKLIRYIYREFWGISLSENAIKLMMWLQKSNQDWLHCGHVSYSSILAIIYTDIHTLCMQRHRTCRLYWYRRSRRQRYIDLVKRHRTVIQSRSSVRRRWILWNDIALWCSQEVPYDVAGPRETTSYCDIVQKFPTTSLDLGIRYRIHTSTRSS